MRRCIEGITVYADHAQKDIRAGKKENGMNSSEKAYDHEQFLADFIECACPGMQEAADMAEYDEAIAEIRRIIAYCIKIGDKKEAAIQRKELQRTKVAKRRAKKKMDNKNRREPAHT